jgi:hypothetical protein
MVDEVLAHWSNQRDNYLYPYQLVRVLEIGSAPLTRPLREEVMSVLARAELYRPSNSALLLAWQVTVSGLTNGPFDGQPGDVRLSIEVLAREFPRLADSLTIQLSLQIARLLITMLPAGRRPPYVEILQRVVVALRESAQRRLQQQLLAKYGFALDILECVDIFELFDLPFAGPAPESHGSEQLLVYRPMLVIDGPAGRAIAREYVFYGHVLFATDHRPEGPAYDTLRRQFDAVARKDAIEFYDIITTRDSLPTPLRDMLRRHREQVRTKLEAWSSSAAESQ